MRLYPMQEIRKNVAWENFVKNLENHPTSFLYLRKSWIIDIFGKEGIYVLNLPPSLTYGLCLRCSNWEICFIYFCFLSDEMLNMWLIIRKSLSLQDLIFISWDDVILLKDLIPGIWRFYHTPQVFL